MKRKPYPTDLTDNEWAIFKPLIPKARAGGRPRSVDMREIVNAIFYVLIPIQSDVTTFYLSG